jgi:hypothetical protein
MTLNFISDALHEFRDCFSLKATFDALQFLPLAPLQLRITEDRLQL